MLLWEALDLQALVVQVLLVQALLLQALLLQAMLQAFAPTHWSCLGFLSFCANKLVLLRLSKLFAQNMCFP